MLSLKVQISVMFIAQLHERNTIHLLCSYGKIRKYVETGSGMFITRYVYNTNYTKEIQFMFWFHVIRVNHIEVHKCYQTPFSTFTWQAKLNNSSDSVSAETYYNKLHWQLRIFATRSILPPNELIQVSQHIVIEFTSEVVRTVNKSQWVNST